MPWDFWQALALLFLNIINVVSMVLLVIDGDHPMWFRILCLCVGLWNLGMIPLMSSLMFKAIQRTNG